MLGDRMMAGCPQTLTTNPQTLTFALSPLYLRCETVVNPFPELVLEGSYKKSFKDEQNKNIYHILAKNILLVGNRYCYSNID